MTQIIGLRSRMDEVQAPIVAVIGDIIRQVPGTISLGQGVAHYGPPPAALDAARAALHDPATHEYQDGAGTPELIARLTDKLARENGIEIGRGWDVMVTAGANMAFVHALLSITDPGDEIILNAPYYFNHEMAVRMADCRPVTVPTDARYQLQPEAIRRAITDRTRAVVTVSPNNPSGAVLSESSLRVVNALCAEHGIYHMADEVYEYFTYGSARHVSAGHFPDAAAHTIAMYSLSKAYGFAGWRIGYVAYPSRLTGAMMKSQDTILVCPTVIAQVAAVAALDVGRGYCEPYIREFADVRNIVRDRLGALAPLAEVSPADGAFYVVLRVNADLDPMIVSERLIREHRVAVIPGGTFGLDGCCFRVSYGALQRQTVAEGIGRLVTGLRHIVG